MEKVVREMLGQIKGLDESPSSDFIVNYDAPSLSIAKSLALDDDGSSFFFFLFFLVVLFHCRGLSDERINYSG